MPLPEGSRLTRQKRLMLTVEDERAAERLASSLADALGTSVKLSHVLRACLVLLRHGEEHIQQRAERTSLRRPPNEQHEAVADFEERLARVILSGIRDAGWLPSLKQQGKRSSSPSAK